MAELLGALSDLSGQVSNIAAWLTYTRPAAWRGVPFAVEGTTTKQGRRTATHEYPFRSSIWIEDLGRGKRSIEVRGFLVGNDVDVQRRNLVAACEKQGAGTLYHPGLTPSSRMVALTDSTFTDDLANRVVKVTLAFVETEDKLYPSSAVSAFGAIADKADNLLKSIGIDIDSAAEKAGDVIEDVAGYAAKASELVGRASIAVNAVTSIGSGLGRYSSKGGGLFSGVTDVRSALSKLTAARSAVASAGKSLSSVAEAL